MKIAALLAALALPLGISGIEGTRAAQSFHRNQPARVKVDAAVSRAEVEAGQSFSLTLRVSPLPGIHVYAPGNPEYIPVSLSLDPQSRLQYGETSFPKAEDYFFAPLKEVVKVYSKPFTITQPVTVAGSLGDGKEPTVPVTITGTLHYQACDDRVCFPPQSAEVSASIVLRRNRR